ncbi:MAG: nitroreductase family protein [Rubripirellula sp.]|nr:nitroreductase family protein [Rubripirellula sp.]
MANLGLSVDELLKTTRAVRKRLDFDRPVPDQVLRECVEYAIQAPTGSNVQGWHFVLVTERDKIEKIAAIYKKAFDWYRDSPVYAGRVVEGISEQRDAQQARVADSADYLAENMHRSPALFIPCMEGRNATAGAAGSIVPAAWSFMLAAREQGLGTCWTTLHLLHEQEAADVLGIPFDDVQQWALSPVAYTAGTDFKPATRPDVETVISWNSWTG